MVKTPEHDSAVLEPRLDAPNETLRRESRELLRPRRLNQSTPVTPLQLSPVDQTVNTLLLGPGRNVAVLSDRHGRTPLAVAQARPHWQVTGWLPDAKSLLDLRDKDAPANLQFDKAPKNSVKAARQADAVLAIAWAHQVFSEHHFHVGALVNAVRGLIEALPANGQLLIQDFALPDDHEQFVILELDNDEAAEALQAFAQSARPHAPDALRGFFVETIPGGSMPRFRLQKKWAVEFYHRWRLGITANAPFELTTLSLEQWVGLLEQCGARATYRAPQAIDRDEGRDVQQELRFYGEDGKIQSLPPSTFILLAEKIATATPLVFYERRIASDKAKDILVTGLKNTMTEDKLDIVEIRHHEDDVLPWYRDDEGRLHVLVQTGVPRPVINTVPRGKPNLDGRAWAGYLIEPLTIPHSGAEISGEFILECMAGLMPQFVGSLGIPNNAIEYYPAPDYLVQRVRGILLPLLPENTGQILPDITTPHGRLIDVLADDVLYAISSGLIPDGKLEILISRLMLDLGMKPADRGSLPLQAKMERAAKIVTDRSQAKLPKSIAFSGHLEDFIADKPSEKMRAVRSIFAEDNASDYGRNVVNYTEQDFILPNILSDNTAVVVAISRDPVGKLLIAGEMRRLPIPDRMGTDKEMAHLPSFSLPGTIRSMDDARGFLAQNLGCDADDLHVLGPSFFVQPQISAERVYPFLLLSPVEAVSWLRWYRPEGKLQDLIDRHVEKSAAYVEFKTNRILGEWYHGFGPEMAPDMTQAKKQKTAANTVTMTEVLARHPAAQMKPG